MAAEFSLDCDGWEKLECVFGQARQFIFCICKEPDPCTEAHTCRGPHTQWPTHAVAPCMAAVIDSNPFLPNSES